MRWKSAPLAAADRLVSALHLGVGDFAASIGARSAEFGAFRDVVATSATAAAMGFDGKQVIHPTQIEATKCFYPLR
jgi:malyl-CoA/(S)-citramalyl-CoA lyase